MANYWLINGINRLINGLPHLIHGLTWLLNGWGARPGPRGRRPHPPTHEYFDRDVQLLGVRTCSTHDLSHDNHKKSVTPSILGATGASRPTLCASHQRVSQNLKGAKSVDDDKLEEILWEKISSMYSNSDPSWSIETFFA